MEDDLCDVVNMGRISAKLMSAGDNGKHEDMLVFAVYHLEEMLIRFKEKYDHDDWMIRGVKIGANV